MTVVKMNKVGCELGKAHMLRDGISLHWIHPLNLRDPEYLNKALSLGKMVKKIFLGFPGSAQDALGHPQASGVCAGAP